MNGWIQLFQMLIALFLIALAASQACPGCKWDACQITRHGLQNCSSCESGALMLYQPLMPNPDTPSHPYPSEPLEFVGICQPCPVGCSTCVSGYIGEWWGCFVGINCTQCSSGYGYNYSSGGCAACPSCSSCTCDGDSCWSMSCLTNSTTALQTDQSSGDNSSGAIIGLSIWGGVMTIVAGVFIVMYLRNRDTKTVPLLGSQTQTRQVTF